MAGSALRWKPWLRADWLSLTDACNTSAAHAAFYCISEWRFRNSSSWISEAKASVPMLSSLSF
eukprot:IDg6890t1